MTWADINKELTEPRKSKYSTGPKVYEEKEKKPEEGLGSLTGGLGKRNQSMLNRELGGLGLGEKVLMNEDIAAHIQDVAGTSGDTINLMYMPLPVLNYSIPWKEQHDFEDEELSRFIPESSGSVYGHMQQVSHAI